MKLLLEIRILGRVQIRKAIYNSLQSHQINGATYQQKSAELVQS